MVYFLKYIVHRLVRSGKKIKTTAEKREKMYWCDWVNVYCCSQEMQTHLRYSNTSPQSQENGNLSIVCVQQ